MHKVLLTDSMPEVLEDMVFSLGKHFEVQTCCKGRDVLEHLERFCPELLVLDLSMPGYDFRKILEICKKRKILTVTTALNATDYIIDQLDRNGIRLLMLKPVQSRAIAVRLLELELDLKNSPDKSLRAAVFSMLNQLNCQLRFTGYEALAEAIVYCCKHQNCAMMDELYPYVAETIGSTAAAVEKAIGRCIEKTFKRRYQFLWDALFGFTDVDICPTNGKFIKYVAYAIKTQTEPVR